VRRLAEIVRRMNRVYLAIYVYLFLRLVLLVRNLLIDVRFPLPTRLRLANKAILFELFQAPRPATPLVLQKN
jgi:hypothetical protein